MGVMEGEGREVGVMEGEGREVGVMDWTPVTL